MIVDATCAPSQIAYPQDVSLLNKARECSEKIIDELHVKGEQKPRTYRKNAHKDYTSYARIRKPKAKQRRKAIKKQLGYLNRNIGHIEKMLAGPALGRPKKDAEVDKKQNYIDECERVEVERKFSLAKRKCGMDMIVTRLKETTCHSIAMSVLLLNLRRIEKLRSEILALLFRSLKLGFVQ